MVRVLLAPPWHGITHDHASRVGVVPRQPRPAAKVPTTPYSTDQESEDRHRNEHLFALEVQDRRLVARPKGQRPVT
jgi:hypothetical protein